MTRPVPRLPRLLDIAEAAECLKVSEKTVRRMLDRGELPFIPVGRQIRIAEDDLLGLIRGLRKYSPGGTNNVR